ncbi:polysaccharide biosynthesis tyrosine autokinase [Actinomycetes bacterium M1A6_2h]
MDIRDYLAAWRSRWMTIVVCVVLAVAVAAGVSALTQPQYAATSRLFVSATGGASVGEAYQGNLFSTARVTSYASLAVGKQVAQRAVDQLGLNEPPEAVMARVTAVAVPDSVLLDVTATDPNPELARDLANVVASQTSSLVQELETSARGGVPAATATIVDLADLPATPATPSWWRNLLFGLLSGLVLGLVAAVARVKLDRSIRSDRDLAVGSGVPVLGSLPADPKAGPGVVLFGPDHQESTEAFRNIRTNILAADSASPVRTVVVSAPRPGAGASTVAAGLATALAETKRSVVLIDGNFHDGTVKATFHTGDVSGLREFLEGRAELDDVVTPTQYENLSVVIAGGLPGSGSELLGTATMSEFVKQLHGYFEFVIIDGPAILQVTDTAVLAGVSDGVLIVARMGKTTGPDIVEAASKLALAKAHLVGSISTGRRRRTK